MNSSTTSARRGRLRSAIAWVLALLGAGRQLGDAARPAGRGRGRGPGETGATAAPPIVAVSPELGPIPAISVRRSPGLSRGRLVEPTVRSE